MKKKHLYILQIILFLVLLGAGSGAIVIGICEGKEYSALEKRELKKFPDLTWQTVFNGDFESGLTDALSDHFWGRDAFVTAKTRAQILLGKREIDGIYIDEDRLIEIYKNDDFDEKLIRENESTLTSFMASIAANIGTEHVKLALVPSKCSLYRDHMPSYLPQSTRADSLANELRESLADELAAAVPDEASEDDEGDPDADTSDAAEKKEEEDLGFDFDEGDPDADASDADTSDAAEKKEEEDLGFNFDEGDPDADASDAAEKKEEEDLGFNFDEGDPDADASDADTSDAAEKKEEEDLGFNFDEGDPDAGKEEVSEDDVTEDETADGETADEDSRETKKSPYSGLSEEEIRSKAKEDADRMVIDLLPSLKQHEKEYIYYRTDHHWTTLGAFYAYQELSEAMDFTGGAAVSDQDMKNVADDFLGTDYNRIHYYREPDVIRRCIIPSADNAQMEINNSGDKTKYTSIYDEDALKIEDKYNYFFRGNYSAITVTTDAKNDKTLLLIKDSFSNSLVPFLCQDYKTIIMVDLRYVNSSVYDYLPEDQAPDDVMIVYNEEKFMQDTHQSYLS